MDKPKAETLCVIEMRMEIPFISIPQDQKADIEQTAIKNIMSALHQAKRPIAKAALELRCGYLMRQVFRNTGKDPDLLLAVD